AWARGSSMSRPSRGHGRPLRVIAGDVGGQTLVAPRGERTRPTAGRVKEALFAALAADGVVGASVLDAYAGSGALAIEALSRGARPGPRGDGGARTGGGGWSKGPGRRPRRCRTAGKDGGSAPTGIRSCGSSARNGPGSAPRRRPAWLLTRRPCPLGHCAVPRI